MFEQNDENLKGNFYKLRKRQDVANIFAYKRKVNDKKHLKSENIR